MRAGDGSGAALYRFEKDDFDSSAFDAAFARALRAHLRSRQAGPEAVYEVALQLTQLGRLDESLQLLEELRARGVRMPRGDDVDGADRLALGAPRTGPHTSGTMG
jgi:predicted Zn-dependent protease